MYSDTIRKKYGRPYQATAMCGKLVSVPEEDAMGGEVTCKECLEKQAEDQRLLEDLQK